MKILFFLSNISLRGGTERACISVCNELAMHGYEVHICSVGGNLKKPAYPLGENIKLKGLDIQEQGMKLRLYLPRIYFELRRYLKQNDISFLVNVEVMSCLFTLPLLYFRVKNLKYLVWEHFNYGVDLGLKRRRLFRKIAAKRADAIITLTHKDKQMWSEYLKPKALLVTIYNPSPFPLSVSAYQDNSKSIIAVGRFTYQKGYDLLIESWKILQNMQNKNTREWKLSIIGGGEDRPVIEKLIKDYGLSESVNLIANTNQIGHYYQNASFLCMSSRFEGLPMVLIEAQSYGLPIVAFDCQTGPSDIIIENSGYLCPPFDTKCLADRLLKMISNDDGRKEMSSQAKKLATRFAPYEIAKSWDSFLQSL